MEPKIPFGGLELVSSVKPDELHPGEIVLFRNPEAPSHLVTHRIVEISDDRQFVTTKGDANPTADAPVPIENVVGRFQRVIPYAGYAVVWLRSGLGRTLGVLLPGVAIVLSEAFSVFSTLRERRAARPGVAE